jgi:endonuclease/exonuclease/phosphatase family metal-dependent hydrolase
LEKDKMMEITCATYNILHGCYKDKIFKNIQLLLDKGADVICIQESEIPLESILPPGWQIEYFHGKIHGCALATLWNKSKLNFIREDKILLPVSAKKIFIMRLTEFYNRPLQRGCLSISFEVGGKILRINNVHLSCETDTNHRLKQLKHIFATLSGNKADIEIFLGDFNTAAPLIFKRYQEKKLEECFGEKYVNVFHRLRYSCCYVSEFDPQDGMAKVKKVLRFLGVNLKSRLDYIFARNLKVIRKEMLDLPGSDHRPLVATFEI